MTELSEAQLDRLAKLSGGRATTAESPAPKNKRRRRHPAQGSRIVAAGLGAGTMFGIVTVLGMNNPISQAEAPEPPAPQPAVAPPVEVRVHMIPAASTVPAAARAISVGAASPIELTANPVVRTITVAAPTQAQPQVGAAPSAPASQPAPVATTSGSS